MVGTFAQSLRKFFGSPFPEGPLRRTEVSNVRLCVRYGRDEQAISFLTDRFQEEIQKLSRATLTQDRISEIQNNIMQQLSWSARIPEEFVRSAAHRIQVAHFKRS